MKHSWTGARLVAALVGIGVQLGSSLCWAEEPRENNFRAPWTPSERTFRGPETHVQFGLGVLALPTTKVCVVSPGTCTKGDIDATGDLTMLFRPLKFLQFGAGITMSAPTGEDTPSHSTSEIPRSHHRQYLLIDLRLREYVFYARSTDFWVGASAGGVVVYDYYKTKTTSSSAPIIGPAAITLRTEGLNLGLATGASWRLFDNWSVEGAIRLAWWLLPTERNCAATGDCASLTGDIAMFWMGVGVAYHSVL